MIGYIIAGNNICKSKHLSQGGKFTKDEYEFIELDYSDPHSGIMVKVLSAGKMKVTIFPFIHIATQQTYIIPPEDLKSVEEDSCNAQLIDDYGVLYTHYRY